MDWKDEILTKKEIKTFPLTRPQVITEKKKERSKKLNKHE